MDAAGIAPHKCLHWQLQSDLLESLKCDTREPAQPPLSREPVYSASRCSLNRSDARTRGTRGETGAMSQAIYMQTLRDSQL